MNAPRPPAGLPSYDVVMPAYNNAPFVAAAVRSVLAQTVPPQRVIVVDDGSKDGTPEEARRFGEAIQLIAFETNRGANSARNAGIAASTAPLIALLDADDAWKPEKMERQLPEFAAAPGLGLSYTGIVDCDERLVPLADQRRFRERHLERVFDELFVTPFAIPPSAIVVRRQVIDECGAFQEGLRKAQDYEFCLRATMRFPLSCVPEPLVWRRTLASSITSSTSVANRIAAELSVFDLCAAAAEKHGVRLPMALDERKALNLRRWLLNCTAQGKYAEARIYRQQLRQRGWLRPTDDWQALKRFVTTAPRTLARRLVRG